ncbi:class II aldolase/adducin family protein [Sulfitobacter sp.]|uniref:class II aldolase/adducin family protein n=1 Tax=Sulfitobacter sp. TaxID=1903071 RepID=UPI003002226A
MREQIGLFARSILDSGLTSGSTRNISARLSDATVLMTPTGSSIGFLDPARISCLFANIRPLSGDAPTREIPLHTAFYDTRAETGAVWRETISLIAGEPRTCDRWARS